MSLSLKLSFQIFISALIWGFSSAAPVEDSVENRIIGYGLTDTGKTVLSAVLIGTLGLVFFASGNSPIRARRRQLQLQEKRRQFIEDCRIFPDLPECVDSLHRGQRIIQKRRKLKRN